MSIKQEFEKAFEAKELSKPKLWTSGDVAVWGFIQGMKKAGEIAKKNTFVHPIDRDKNILGLCQHQSIEIEILSAIKEFGE